MASRILIVEDDPTQRRILEELVKRFGFEAIAADGGLKGLEVLNGPSGGSIELIILDLMMPGMDGLEFLEKMQGVRGDLPVIVQTAQGSIETVIKAMRAGADDFVVKPVSPERLKISIQNLLKVNALTEEVKRLNKKVGGTLFLDEVADLPLDMQVKLLRAIQEGEIDPVGARKSVKVNIRLVSATNRNMIEMVKAGQFREDLYYRLNVYPMMVPPLRDRKDDIPALAEHFITRLSAEEGRKVRGIASNALAMLGAYAWPGNVRQLENTIFRAIVLCESDVLEVQDFPQIASLVEGYEITIPPAPVMAARPAAPTGPAMMGGVHVVGRSAGNQVSDGMALGIPVVTDGGHIRKLEEVEADMIRLALNRYRGQMSEVARKLGIGRSTLYRKMRDLGLEEATG